LSRPDSVDDSSKGSGKKRGRRRPVIEPQRFTELPTTVEQSMRAVVLPVHHRDRFDRWLVAQAQLLDPPIASPDAGLDRDEATPAVVADSSDFPFTL
jgi:hypothetical protein